MNGDSSGVQQSTPGDEDLQDFQQPWYKPQHLPYYASPAQEHASRSFEKETRQSREEELLEVIAQLEKDLQELHSSSSTIVPCDASGNNTTTKSMIPRNAQNDSSTRRCGNASATKTNVSRGSKNNSPKPKQPTRTCEPPSEDYNVNDLM
ncbi:hypothetical protein BGZ91_000153 [Linnemannia elongata]|nr:hypothetical protein BGZ91_000153 [Linnemannia elongata]